jgi:hypothetical protein
MTALQGAVEATAPVSRLHEHQSYELADADLVGACTLLPGPALTPPCARLWLDAVHPLAGE